MASGKKVDINKARVEDLEELLIGVGHAKAEAIVEARKVRISQMCTCAVVGGKCTFERQGSLGDVGVMHDAVGRRTEQNELISSLQTIHAAAGCGPRSDF